MPSRFKRFSYFNIRSLLFLACKLLILLGEILSWLLIGVERSNKKFTESYFFCNSWLKIENKKAKKKKLSSTASADVLVLRQIIEPKQQEVKFVSLCRFHTWPLSLYSKMTSQVSFILRPIFENQTKITSNPIAFILIQFCLLYRLEEFRNSDCY